MNRLLCVFVSVFIFVNCFVVNVKSADISISADSAIVMIADTNQIIYEKNSRIKRGIASTTKIMSAIVALESGKSHYLTVVRGADIAVEGTSSGLKAGDEVTLLSLVKGMLLSSGNDAANVTATMVAGSKEAFADLMNKKAKSIGMLSTNFVNPSGLTEEGHYSTAYDMALLGSYVVKNPAFVHIVSMKNSKISYGDRGSVILYNHNKFLSMCDGAVGIKTGFTKAAGRCLVTAVSRNNITVVCVTLNAPDDWNDHIKLIEYAFDNIKTYIVPVITPQVVVAGGNVTEVSTYLSREIIIPYVNEVPEITTRFYVPPFLYPGVKKGDIVGEMIVFCSGREIYRYSLLSNENTYVKSTTSNRKIINKINEFLRKGQS